MAAPKNLSEQDATTEPDAGNGLLDRRFFSRRALLEEYRGGKGRLIFL